MKIRLTALSALLFAAPGFAKNPAAVLNAGQYCGECDALYGSMVDSYEDANERQAAKSNPVFVAKKASPPQPMEIAFDELQSRGAKIGDAGR